MVPIIIYVHSGSKTVVLHDRLFGNECTQASSVGSLRVAMGHYEYHYHIHHHQSAMTIVASRACAHAPMKLSAAAASVSLFIAVIASKVDSSHFTRDVYLSARDNCRMRQSLLGKPSYGTLETVLEGVNTTGGVDTVSQGRYTELTHPQWLQMSQDNG
jgi:hypothetical protein